MSELIEPSLEIQSLPEPQAGDLKWCSYCQDNKPRPEFYKRKKEIDGLARYCKVCYKKVRDERLKRSGQIRIKQRLRKMSPADIRGFKDQPKRIQQIVELVYSDPKMSIMDLAGKLNMSPMTIDQYMRSNNFLRGIRMMGSRNITKLVPKAVLSLSESLEAKSEDVKLKAATKILESEKVLGPERVDVTVNDLTNKSHDELVSILENLKVPSTAPVIEAQIIE